MVVMAILARLSWQLTKSRRRVRRIQQTYYAATEAGGDALFMLRSVFDANGLVIDFVFIDTNTRGEELIGTSKAIMLGMKLCELFPKSRTNGFLKDLATVAQTGVIHEKEWKNAMPTSNAEWLHRQVVAVEDGVVAMVRDISQRKRLEARVQYQATHDVLTSLPNRNLLRDCLQCAIDDVDGTLHKVWVVFVDLDHFKSINDSLGHMAGDSVLKTIAARLQESTQPTDTVARLGGDEFVVILTTTADANVATSTLQRIMDNVAVPIMIEERELTLSCSVGIAVYPHDGQTPDVLIERADIAMYSAKKSGRDNFQFFSAEMNERLFERLRIEEDLRKAIKHNEFVLHYQPQVNLATGKVVGMEALIRWQHPERGMVPPNLFIGIAEETGLICAIGDWVIRTACAQNMAWQRAGFGHLRIAVNLSARQFAQRDLVGSIAGVLEETGMDAHDLEIELTESLVMGDVETAIDVLRNLKKLGVKLSIDDFGTGYSSLSYLKRFPIDVLKIDQSFMRDIVLDTDAATIVSLIISLAHTLHLGVIAEGVETEVQLAYLRRHGCDEMQGYFFSRPVPAEQFTQLLVERKCLQDILT
ncbi:MAG: EAL domain-containing protein [Herminiimonas sp.]|nr:EAL domain-containing protein [Herminiimonas sp.]